MRVIFLFGLCFFYISLFTSGASIEFHSENIVNGTVDPEKQSSEVAKKLTILNLNEDCQLLIFEYLETIDLISLAEAINTPLTAIEYVFKQRAEFIVIDEPKTQSQTTVQDNGDTLFIADIPTLSKVLRKFGHLIKGIRLSFYYNDLSEDESSAVLHEINANCAKTLKIFSITNLHSYNISFEAFKKPFEQVNIVLVGGDFASLRSSELSFKDMFPAIEQLLIKPSITLQDPMSLDYKLPTLKSMDVDVWTYNFEKENKFDEDFCKRFIMKNPQIQALELRDATPRLVQSVAEELPELLDLKLVCYKEESAYNESFNMHFENLKIFAMERVLNQTLPVTISFGNLEYVSFEGYSTTCTRWLELVKHQTTLKGIQVNRHVLLPELMELEEADLGLTHIQIDSPSTSYQADKFIPKMECIVRIIEKSRKLEVFAFYTKYKNMKVFNFLQERLSSNWTVKMSEGENFVNVVRQ